MFLKAKKFMTDGSYQTKKMENIAGMIMSLESLSDIIRNIESD